MGICTERCSPPLRAVLSCIALNSITSYIFCLQGVRAKSFWFRAEELAVAAAEERKEQQYVEEAGKAALEAVKSRYVMLYVVLQSY